MDLRHRRHDHRSLCSRAAHELRDSAEFPTPSPPARRSHAPAVLRNSALQIAGPCRRDRAHRREHDRPDALPRRRRLRPLHRPHRLPPDRSLALGVRAQRHRDPLVRERRATRGCLRLADRAAARASRPLRQRSHLPSSRSTRTHDTPLTAVILTTIAMILAGVNLTIPTALQARLDFRLAVVLDLTARAVSFAMFVAAALDRHVGRTPTGGSSRRPSRSRPDISSRSSSVSSRFVGSRSRSSRRSTRRRGDGSCATRRRSGS